MAWQVVPEPSRRTGWVNSTVGIMFRVACPRVCAGVSYLVRPRRGERLLWPLPSVCRLAAICRRTAVSVVIRWAVA
jgi:hypothetical protein